MSARTREWWGDCDGEVVSAEVVVMLVESGGTGC